MTPCDILKTIPLAVAFAGIVAGCSPAARHAGASPNVATTPLPPPYVYHAVTNAINRQDWKTLRAMALPGSRAEDYVRIWKNYAADGHPVRVGKLIGKQDSEYGPGKQPCTIYAFEWLNEDGTVGIHQLQVVIQKDGPPVILDFWNFGW